jgi:hypothetical protein
MTIERRVVSLNADGSIVVKALGRITYFRAKQNMNAPEGIIVTSLVIMTDSAPQHCRRDSRALVQTNSDVGLEVTG